MPLDSITALHLHREWQRLLASGGHDRYTKEARPLSARTVRCIASTVSGAFSRAIKWGLIDKNPATHSEPPVPQRRPGVAFTTAQQDTVIAAASGPWCMSALLAVDAALGARRGELLALRWQDIVDGKAIIARTLVQTKAGVQFLNRTKTGKPRAEAIPEETMAILEAHRKRQDEFRAQYGADYCTDLDLVFAREDGSPFLPSSISATVSKLCRRLGFPKGASLHSLRHSHVSQLIASGVPLPAVAARVGHASTETTARVYAHMITGQDEEAAAKWQEYQRKNRPAEGAQPGGRVQ
jgi:integrase